VAAKDRPPPDAVCPWLCGNQATTWEHILPLWVDRIFPGIKTLAVEIGGKPVGTPQEHDEFSLKMPICDPCHKWMNKHFENPIQQTKFPEMVRTGDVKLLQHHDRRVITAWALKTMITYHYSRPPEVLKPLPYEWVRSFRRKGSIPINVISWVGGFYWGEDGTVAMPMGETGSIGLSDRTRRERLVFTLALGHVSLQVAVYFDISELHNISFLLPITGQCIPIWPSLDRHLLVKWPPDVWFDAAQLRRITKPRIIHGGIERPIP
jgi:hypothetical protein